MFYPVECVSVFPSLTPSVWFQLFLPVPVSDGCVCVCLEVYLCALWANGLQREDKWLESQWEWPQQAPPPFRPSQDCYCRSKTSCSAAVMKGSNIITLRPPPGGSALASNCMNLVSDQAERCVFCILTAPELRPDLMFQCRLLQAVQSLLFCPIILILSGSCVTWPLTFETSSILKLVTGYFLECHGSCWDSCCCFCLLLGPTKGRTMDPKLPKDVAAPPRGHGAASAHSNTHLISLTGTVD